MKGYSRSKEDFRELLYTKYFTMPEIENGCLGDGILNTDYLLCNGFEDALPSLVQQDSIIYEYNQYKQQRSKKSCTVFSAIGAISDLFNYEFSLDEIKEIDDMSYTRGRMKDSGWWVQAAVKLVADRRNEHKANKVAYYRVSVEDENIIKDILNKGYTLMTNFNGNYAYIKDYDSDGILNGTSFGASTFGHAINVRSVKGKRSCKDSAAGTEHNIYELEHTLKEIKCYSSNAYIYTKVGENQLERIKKLNKIRTLILSGIPINSELWEESGSKTHKDKLHEMNDFYRDWLSYIDKELKEYT